MPGTEARITGAQFHAVANHTLDVILVAGLDGFTRYISPACRRLTGYAPAELLGHVARDLVHPKDRDRLKALLGTLSGGENCTTSCRVRRKDGSYVWIQSTISVLRDSVSAQALEVVVIARDISAWKRVEDNIGLIEAAPHPMILVDADGLISIANSETAKLCGYEPGELVGKPVEILVPERFRGDRVDPRNAFYSAITARPMDGGRELAVLHRDGSEIPVQISLDPVGTPEGQVLIVSLIDLTERRKSEAHLELFRAIVEGARDYAIFALDPAGFVLNWNEGAARLKGYSESEILGQHFSIFYTPDDTAAHRPANALRIARDEGKYQDEGWRVRRNGSRFWAIVVITVLRNPDGSFRGFSKLTRDITERRQYEEYLRESAGTLQLLADSMPQIVWTALADGFVDYFNDRWYALTGASRGLKGDDAWQNMIHPADLQPTRQCWSAAIDSGDPYEMEFRIWDWPRGEYRWYLCRALAQRNPGGTIVKWIGTATDIDDYKKLHDELESRVDERTAELSRSLAEKTTLLQEVHHRVKNNLQIICSLLSMQIDSSDCDLLNAPLHNAHARILAMSLIHEQIYQSSTLAHLNFGEYIERLADRLFGAYCVSPTRIRLELSVEPIHLTVDQAIPCGLILNELVTNSLKHAFGDGRAGAIFVTLRRAAGNGVELTVADNGIGLPSGFHAEESRSLGLQVVQTLIAQLRADLVITSDDGASFSFTWKLPPLPEANDQ